MGQCFICGIYDELNILYKFYDSNILKLSNTTTPATNNNKKAHNNDYRQWVMDITKHYFFEHIK